MKLRLPPLSALQIFDAAARCSSFKTAAEEMHVTASAVSHSIQTLEEWLGVELFRRTGRSVTLTPAGEVYFPYVNRALCILAGATEQIPGRRSTGAMTISCAPTFANRWLLPRLSSFTKANPSLRVSIDTSHRRVDLPLEGFDAAIRMASDERAGKGWSRLVRETLVPVCTRELLAKFQNNDSGKIFASAPLIHVTSVSSDWREWTDAVGIQLPETAAALRVDTIQLALDAAKQGLGIAIGRRPIVDDDLASGRLVAVSHHSVTSATSYWFVTSDSNFEFPEIKQLRKWLLDELQMQNAIKGCGLDAVNSIEGAAPK